MLQLPAVVLFVDWKAEPQTLNFTKRTSSKPDGLAFENTTKFLKPETGCKNTKSSSLQNYSKRNRR